MKWYAYVIIALVIAVAVLAYLCSGFRAELKDCKRIDSAQYAMHREDFIRHTLEVAEMEARSTRYKHEKDSVIQHYAPKLSAANAIIKRQRGQLASVAVIVAADSSEFTEAQLHIRDSLINTQDQQIANLYGERAALKVSTEALIDNLEAKARLSEDEVSKWIGRFQASEAGRMADQKAWKRQRRWERVAEIGAVVLIGIIAL